MSLILDGTNGLSDVDGTAGTPAIRGSDANTGVFFGTDIVGVSTGGSERMRVDASGNVGIGTNSPTVKLDVLGASGASTIYSRVTGTTSADSAQMQCVNGSVIFQAYAYSSAAEVSVGSASNHPLLFRTNTTERMRITSDGNVGIGTGSPGYKLTVSSGRAAFTGSQNVGTLRTATGSLGGAEIVSTSNADAAFMAFHRPGAFASYFGLDTDNWFAVGGWSYGAALGNFKCAALSKASGSFKIDHPLPEKNGTHYLVHSFVEGPQADNIYRGKVELAEGRAEVNIDSVSGMTEGTFVVLNRDVQCFTSNESDWDAVRGSVNGNILTIECQNATSTATISWMVIGERKDKHMYDTEWTDDDGKVIVEPLKATVSVVAEQAPTEEQP